MASDQDKMSGCVLVMVSLVVTAPMWLILLFALMNANDMPVWSWVLYWCYVPAHVFSIVLALIVKHLME